jgi:flagellar motor switch protein FliM
MADILSQEEIEALLETVDNDVDIPPTNMLKGVQDNLISLFDYLCSYEYLTSKENRVKEIRDTLRYSIDKIDEVINKLNCEEEENNEEIQEG